MMYYWVLGAACLSTVFENRTQFPWNDFDRNTYRYVKREGCAKMYGPDTPCVRKFIKYGVQDYSVICGAPSPQQEP